MVLRLKIIFAERKRERERDKGVMICRCARYLQISSYYIILFFISKNLLHHKPHHCTFFLPINFLNVFQYSSEAPLFLNLSYLALLMYFRPSKNPFVPKKYIFIYKFQFFHFISKMFLCHYVNIGFSFSNLSKASLELDKCHYKHWWAVLCA